MYHRGMKNIMIALFLMLSTSLFVSGQTPKPADPKDVGSMDAIMKAIYDVISGEKGKPRDWDRFRSLFHNDGRLIPSGKNAQTGVINAFIGTPDEYATRAQASLLTEAFRERIGPPRRYVETSPAFSTYESRHAPGESQPAASTVFSSSMTANAGG